MRASGISFLVAAVCAATSAWAAEPSVSLQVGGKKIESGGPVECKSAPVASIHGVMAALHSARHRSGERSVSLTLWQPKDGKGEMVTLHVAEGRNRVEVDTVKGGSKRDTRGSAKVTLQKSGSGGVFTIDAVAAGGEKVTGRIACERFGAVHAEGG